MQPVSPWTAALRVAVLSSSLFLSGLYLHWKSGRPLPMLGATKSADETVNPRPNEPVPRSGMKTFAELAGHSPIVETRMVGTKSAVLDFDLSPPHTEDQSSNAAPQASVREPSPPRETLMMGTKSYSGSTIVVAPGTLEVRASDLGAAEKALQLPGSQPPVQQVPPPNGPQPNPFAPYPPPTFLGPLPNGPSPNGPAPNISVPNAPAVDPFTLPPVQR